MKINYTKIWSGNKKVLFDESLSQYRIEIEKINVKNEYSFYLLERGQFTSYFKQDILNIVSFKKLNRTYHNNKNLQQYYTWLIDLCKQEKIFHIVFTSTGQYWHPDFLKQLKKHWITIALSTADDDYWRINYCSLPRTKYYDYHFYVWVMYDKSWKTIADKLREYWWNPVRVPLWARADHISKIERERDIDVVYIWNVNPRKLFRLSKLKRHFGDRLKLYWWQWNWDWKSLKGILYKIANKIFRLWYIEAISDEKLIEIYSRAKIGFNMHLVPWKWPSNSRMYELPCNKIMQLCDNVLGLSRIFDVWKEVVWYDWIDDAIQKIEYYLKHDDERRKIANAWYEKAIKQYKAENMYKTILGTVFEN